MTAGASGYVSMRLQFLGFILKVPKDLEPIFCHCLLAEKLGLRYT